jgi:hypothetical protein
MTVSHTTNSSAERKLTVRLKIAARLHKALRDGGGRVVARNEPQHMSGAYRNLPFIDAPSLVPADGFAK